jgi:hypothetical protein
MVPGVSNGKTTAEINYVGSNGDIIDLNVLVSSS